MRGADHFREICNAAATCRAPALLPGKAVLSLLSLRRASVLSVAVAVNTAEGLPAVEELRGGLEASAARTERGDPGPRRGRAPFRQARLDHDRPGRDELTLPRMPVRVANDHDHPAGGVERRDRLSFAHQEHLRPQDGAEAAPRL